MKRAVVTVAILGGAMVAAGACSANPDGARSNEATTVDAGGVAITDARTAQDAPVATLSVELGTGSASFIPIANGADVDMVRGKQGFQHIWISARVLDPDVREAVITISTTQPDGRSAGPDLSAAVSLDPFGAGTEKVGLTGLVDYGVKGELVHVRLEVRTPSGLFGFDERTVHVLAPVDYECTMTAGAGTCTTLCGSLACTTCETGTTSTGYVLAGDASTPIASCAQTFELDTVRTFACCCCR